MASYRVIVREIYCKEYLVESPRAIDLDSAMRLVNDGEGTFVDSWPVDRLPMSEWTAELNDMPDIDEDDEDIDEDEEPVEVPTRFVRTTRTPVTEEEVEDVDFGNDAKS